MPRTAKLNSIVFAAPMVVTCLKAVEKHSSCSPHRNVFKTVQTSAKAKKISFGGIPNCSSIDVFMPYAIFDSRALFCTVILLMWAMLTLFPVIKAITGLLLSRLQGNLRRGDESQRLFRSSLLWDCNGSLLFWVMWLFLSLGVVSFSDYKSLSLLYFPAPPTGWLC